MIKRSSFIAAAAALALFANANPARAELAVDLDNSGMSFSVKHLTLTTVSGTVRVQSASISAAADGTPTAAEATLDLKSIDTQSADRDSDLRSDHWFDIAKFPLAQFKSTKITGDKSAMKMTGDLTFHGVTNPVTLDVKYDGAIKDRRGHTHLGYTATTTIDRTKWNLGGNFPDVVVGNEVTITINLEAISS